MNTDDRIIELQELRVGSLLDYKGELVQVTMLSRDIDDEYEDQICFVKHGTSTDETGGWNRSLVNDLKRIPLTPEWLERFGYKKHDNKYYHNESYLNNLGPIGLVINGQWCMNSLPLGVKNI